VVDTATNWRAMTTIGQLVDKTGQFVDDAAVAFIVKLVGTYPGKSEAQAAERYIDR